MGLLHSQAAKIHSNLKILVTSSKFALFLKKITVMVEPNLSSNSANVVEVFLRQDEHWRYTRRS